MTLLNLAMLANVLIPAQKSALSVDVEDRRNETEIHKYMTIQLDSAAYEFKTYVMKGK